MQTTGVPQGSILGPLPFCLNIYDLPKICKKVGCQMYADGTIIYVIAETSNLAAEIEQTCVYRW